MANETPETHARAVETACVFLEENGADLLDHAVPYADFVEISDEGAQLLFVGSPRDQDLLRDVTACRERCPLNVVGCDVLEILFGNGYATVELTRDVL